LGTKKKHHDNGVFLWKWRESLFLYIRFAHYKNN
jgi:hypothetical protein